MVCKLVSTNTLLFLWPFPISIVSLSNFIYYCNQSVMYHIMYSESHVWASLRARSLTSKRAIRIVVHGTLHSSGSGLRPYQWNCFLYIFLFRLISNYLVSYSIVLLDNRAPIFSTMVIMLPRYLFIFIIFMYSSFHLISFHLQLNDY